MMMKPTTKVYRKQTVEGYSIPAIIHNSSYFFVDIDVYEDGRVACWNFEDFEHFKKDVERGWVSVSVPDGKCISIHGLGEWRIQNSNWLYNKESFVDYVTQIVKELNPGWINIYKYEQKTRNGIRIGQSGNGSLYKNKVEDDLFPEKIDGKSIHLFYKIEEVYYLVKVLIFKDSTFQISSIENPIDLNFEQLEQLVNEGTLLTEIPLNSNVIIYGLGKFTIAEKSFSNDIEDKLAEIKDIIRELNGLPSSIDLCRQAYADYLKNPTVEGKEKLRKTYEDVPEHQKMFVGDQDIKDTAVRMIIYGDEEIENWSHYLLAKATNQTLPTINVPKPLDENKSKQ